ncbi:UNVERIFIED_CONTAM: Cyclin-dependent kinase G-2 [Sesamum latifolium]|uniref:Cyclin-dependent kinase G-2 n=1 Tax=Sesamum latifolium TaxID=2727402 RepID=A0AAW2UJV0_9LAMI
MAEASLVHFLGNKNDRPFLFEPSHSKSEFDHSLLRSLITRRANDYDYLNVISHGSYGIVYRARDKKTGEIVAMKQELNGLSRSTLREIEILIARGRRSQRNHEGQETPLEPKRGEVHDEATARGRQVSAREWSNASDLKPSNILINRKGHLKICDFGLSRQFESEWGSYSPRVGTLWYRAPEILAEVETYSTAIDMWSVGCIMAELLLKEVLFKERCDVDQRTKIYRILGRAKPDENLFMKFLEAAVISGVPLLKGIGFDLLKKLLEYDPDKRITAEAALEHDWFKEFDPYFFWFSARQHELKH